MSEWHVSLTRQFGRDGDTYGRHALLKPGGDNVQRDVLHVIPPRVRDVRRIHPTRFDAEYIGAHRPAGDGLGNWLFSVEAMAWRAGSSR